MATASGIRSFRFSLGDLLSATLILAIFLAVNMVGRAETLSSGPVIFFGTGMVQRDGLRYRAGWPFCYVEIFQYVPYGTGDEVIKGGWPHRERSKFVGINWLPLGANILVATGTALVAPTLLARLSQVGHSLARARLTGSSGEAESSENRD